MNMKNLYTLLALLIIVFLFTQVKNTSITPLEYSDVFEVDEIALYSDGEYMVITQFKQDHTLYRHTSLGADDYYLIADSIHHPLLYIEESGAVTLDCYKNYNQIINSKWLKYLSYEDYVSILDSSKKK